MRKYRYGSSYSSKPKNWLRSFLAIIFVGIPLILLALELGLKNFAPPAWFADKTSIATQSYELKIIETKNDLISAGDLQVRISPISGYDLAPNQTTKFWQINGQGFRHDKPLTLYKEPKDVRIFIVGNSTAFGAMAANNQMTLAPKLEDLVNKRLQQQQLRPEKFQPQVFPYYADQVEKVKLLPPRMRVGNYQVVIAAVPGYTSTNELSLFIHKIIEYKPDCLIFLNGYEDLRAPSNTPARELINLTKALQKTDQPQIGNLQKFQTWLHDFYLVKLALHLSASPAKTPMGYYQVFNANQLAADPQELKLRVVNYDSSLRKIANLESKIPVIVALQPEITGKSNLTDDESKIIKSLGPDYNERIVKSYKALEAKVLSHNFPKIKLISLYAAFKDIKEKIFLDPIHLTDAGNNLVAQKLFNAVEDTFKLQPAPAPEPN